MRSVFLLVDGGVFRSSRTTSPADLRARAQTRVGQIVERFAHERDAEHDKHDGDARNTAVHQMPAVTSETARLRSSPFGGRGRFDAEAQEAQARKGQDGFGGVQRQDDRQGACGVLNRCLVMMRQVEAPTTRADSTYAIP